MKSFILLIVAFALVAYGLDCHSYKKAYLVADSLISKNNYLIPKFVRLSFHDCLVEKCDAYIDMKNPMNKGLPEVISILEHTYESAHLHSIMSRADFWILAGEVALVRGALNVHPHHHHHHPISLKLQFLHGRHDYHSHSYKIHNLPNGHADFKEIYHYVGKTFGLSPEEIVVLMGAHTLGGAHKHNSGFEYNWDSTPLAFDNGYYQNMIHLSYAHTNVAAEHSERRIEFVADAGHDDYEDESDHEDNFDDDDDDEEDNDKLMMLNTDMCLYKHLKSTRHGDKYTGQVSCVDDEERGDGEYIPVPLGAENFVHKKCEYASTAKNVEEYAKDLQKWLDEFPAVWYKMVTHGYSHLTPPSSSHYEKRGLYDSEDGHSYGDDLFGDDYESDKSEGYGGKGEYGDDESDSLFKMLEEYEYGYGYGDSENGYEEEHEYGGYGHGNGYGDSEDEYGHGNGYDDDEYGGYGHAACGHCIPEGGYCKKGYYGSLACCKGYSCEGNECRRNNHHHYY